MRANKEKLTVIIVGASAIIFKGLQYTLRNRPYLVRNALNREECIEMVRTIPNKVIVAPQEEMYKLATPNEINVIKNIPAIVVMETCGEMIINDFKKRGVHGFIHLLNTVQLGDVISNLISKKSFMCNTIIAVLEQERINKQQIHLTKTESTIFKMVVEGKSSEKIALEHELTLTTINTHRKNINKKCKETGYENMIEYAHQTKLAGWLQGRYFVNAATQPATTNMPQDKPTIQPNKLPITKRGVKKVMSNIMLGKEKRKIAATQYNRGEGVGKIAIDLNITENKVLEYLVAEGIINKKNAKNKKVN